MLCYGRGAPAHRHSRSSSALRALAAAAALAAVPAAADAQMIVLNVPDSQVVDTTIRNGPYATYNHNSATLLTRSSTVPERSQEATVVCVGAMSMPTAAAPLARRASSFGQRPPVETPAPISSMSPSARSESTISEMVERWSEVRRAISAREMGPRSRT